MRKSTGLVATMTFTPAEAAIKRAFEERGQDILGALAMEMVEEEFGHRGVREVREPD